jgi:hypothetical protein
MANYENAAWPPPPKNPGEPPGIRVRDRSFNTGRWAMALAVGCWCMLLTSGPMTAAAGYSRIFLSLWGGSALLFAVTSMVLAVLSWQHPLSKPAAFIASLYVMMVITCGVLSQ